MDKKGHVVGLEAASLLDWRQAVYFQKSESAAKLHRLKNYGLPGVIGAVPLGPGAGTGGAVPGPGTGGVKGSGVGTGAGAALTGIFNFWPALRLVVFRLLAALMALMVEPSVRAMEVSVSPDFTT